jgi:hypothetical protein
VIDFFDVKRADQLAAAVGITGCADHGDPDCLCDVKVGQPTEINYVPRWFTNCTEAAMFVRDAELMLGRMEMVDIDRALAATKGKLPSMDPETIELLWHSHADPEVTFRSVAEQLGVHPRQVSAMCEALGLEWISRTNQVRAAAVAHRPRYLELRESGLNDAEARRQMKDETGVQLHHQTTKAWWWKRFDRGWRERPVDETAVAS